MTWPTRGAGMRILSRRRLAALRLAAQDDSHEQIAATLGVRVHTVAVYLSEAVVALDVDDLEQAIELARQLGLFGPGGEAIARLTFCQRDALRLAANGATDAAIGRALGFAPSSANTTLRQAYRILGVDNRTQAVAVAIRLGIVPIETVALPAALLEYQAAELQEAS